MLIAVSKEDLIRVLKQEIKCWESIGGGPNYDAFPFRPKEVDPNKLRELGYYDNKDAWVAGVRLKALKEYLQTIESTEQMKIR